MSDTEAALKRWRSNLERWPTLRDTTDRYYPDRLDEVPADVTAEVQRLAMDLFEDAKLVQELAKGLGLPKWASIRLFALEWTREHFAEARAVTEALDAMLRRKEPLPPRRIGRHGFDRVWEYCNQRLREDPNLTSKELYSECKEQFRGQRMSQRWESFDRWLRIRKKGK